MNRIEKVNLWVRTSPTAWIAITLTCIWLMMLAAFGIGGLIGAPVGLNIHPTGEDRVWTDLLEMPGFRTHRSWWAIASRNPLAPWWYEATGILTAATPAGLFFSKKIVELFMAIAASALLFEIFNRKQLALCVGFGALILTWNFSGYVEQILFVMHIGLGMSLLAAYCYLRFVKTQRKTYQWLLAALASYFIALGTYTIQCGTPLAILALGLAFVDHSDANPKRAARVKTFWDVMYFGIVFVLYSMVWITTSGSTSSYFKLDVSLFLSNAWKSIANLVWHQDMMDMSRTLRENWSLSFLVATVAVSFVLAMGIMKWLSNREKSMPKDDSVVANQFSPIWLLVVLGASIAIPTFAIETMSTTWYPGSRSRMIQQVFQPLLYLVLVLVIARSVSRYVLTYESSVKVWLSAIIALGTMLAWEHNRKLCELSSFEDSLVANLRQLVSEKDQPSRFVVRIDAPDWYGGRNNELNRILMKQSFESDLVSLDAIFPGPADPSTSLRLEADESGVYLPSIKGVVPYNEVKFASFDGKSFEIIDVADEKVFEGFQVIVQRDLRTPRPRLVSSSNETGVFRFDFDQKVPGRGWSVPEVSVAGESFVWMSSSKASIEFVQPANIELQLQFRLLQPVSTEARDSLEVSFRDNPIPIRVVDRSENKWTCEARIPVNQEEELASLTFSVDGNSVPSIAGRKLAVPFDWIRIQPITE